MTFGLKDLGTALFYHVDSTIILENNSFNLCLDGNELLKAENFSNVDFKFVNNTYGGQVIDLIDTIINKAQYLITIGE